MEKKEHKGTENLIPMSMRSIEKKREIALMGARASAEAKKRKKELKALLEIALSMKNDAGIDNYTQITTSLVNRAVNGNIKAYEVIRDTLGQSPESKIKLSDSVDINVNITNSEAEDDVDD